MTGRRGALLVILVAAVAACGTDETTTTDDPTVDVDPLAVTTAPVAGSLDDLHDRIIGRRCSGQPGLCHNGQFEPNLSTPGLTYAYLVNRPAIEVRAGKPWELRVKPHAPAESMFIHKIRNTGVLTQMPLGAEPLPEADIKDLEDWITNGARRYPGAAEEPMLNNPPRRPQLAVYAGSTRLDGAGPISVAVGTTLTLRHTVQDFETPDPMIATRGYSAVILSMADGRAVVLDPTNTGSPHVGRTAYNAAGPMGLGDQLNYERSYTIPATLDLFFDPTKTASTAPASGVSLTLQALYVDEIDFAATPPRFGMIAFDVLASPVVIQ